MSRGSQWNLCALSLIVAFVSRSSIVEGGLVVRTPTDGTTIIATPCQFTGFCRGTFQFEIEVTGNPITILQYVIREPSGFTSELNLCQPPDPIDGTPGCPATPFVRATGLTLLEGSYTVFVRVRRGPFPGVVSEESPPLRLTVLPPNVTPPGPVTLSSVVPLTGSPRLLVRDPDASHPNGISTTPSEVRIFGSNLDNNPFLEVYVAPIPTFDPTLAVNSGLPTSEWCLFRAEILERGLDARLGSFLRVRMPTIPLETPTTCGFSPGPVGSIFTKNWRWIVLDKWIRPQRVHEDWAIPEARTGPLRNAPPFRMVKPDYPDVDGFGFANKASDARYYEFLTVYGNNAYLCVGAFGACLTRLPDPLYHLLWWPIYREVMDSTEGSCNGMSATSLLMAREELQTEMFDPAVRFPAGFDAAGDPATYRDTNFCTPICSPPKPNNLWAHIRMNHGVQFSREFLFELLETLGEAIFNPNDLTSIRGIPGATLDRVRANPMGHVLCFFQPGNGHCVTPYRVQGNRIFIYDNNAPGDETRFIDIVGGDYDYPARTNEPNSGNAIMAFPISIWQDDRHLLGFTELLKLIKGDIVEFLVMIVVGSGDATVTNEAGGRWGFEEDGSFTDAMMGALSIPPLGPQDVPSRAMPLLLAMNQPEPTVQINAKGGHYMFQTAAGGHFFQIEASDAMPGDKDEIRLGYLEQDDLSSFDFTPQRDAAHVVPRIGMVIGETESALFHILGMEVPGGARVGFGADKEARSVTCRNHGDAPVQHLIALDYVSGPTEASGRMIYGPFDMQPGAGARVILANWPDVSQVVCEIDLDGDGTPDRTDVVNGRAATTPLIQDVMADLSVTKSLTFGGGVAYTINVVNAGPNVATDVVMVDALPAGVTLSSIATTRGSCTDTGDGVRCDFGELNVGETAVVTYSATPSGPGTLANAVTVFGNEGDPDLTNNSAVAAAELTPPALVSIAGGLGGVNVETNLADTFISPRGETCPFTEFELRANEPLELLAAETTYTGPSPTPGARLIDNGAGRHLIRFSRALVPGHWMRLDLHVAGRSSGLVSVLTVWVAHQPLDMTQDGRSDIRDATAFGVEFRGRRTASLIDIDCNNTVDVRDATAFGANWNGTIPGTRPWRNTSLPEKP